MQINKPENTLQNISVGSKEINAARVAFFLPGFVISTWAPMIPMVKARLNLEADVLGLLLCASVSALLSLCLWPAHSYNALAAKKSSSQVQR